MGGPLGHRPVDITGNQGLLVQVNGRNSAAVINWLATRDPTWRAQITRVAIDLSPAYARAAREALPHAIVIADRFHLVKKANDMLDAVRRRVTMAARGRRGRKADIEWINRRRLLRGAGRLTADQRATLFAKLLSADPNEDIAAAWIAKSFYATYSRAPTGQGCATRSPPPWTGSTDSAPPPGWLR